MAHDGQRVLRRGSSIPLSASFSSISFSLRKKPALQRLGRPLMNLSIMRRVPLLRLIWVLSLFLLRAQAGEISKRKVLTSLEDAGFCRSYKFAGEKN